MSDFIRPTRFSRLLSRCYPRELREQYADDIARFIDDARRDPRNRNNPFGTLTVASRLTMDAVRSLLASRKIDSTPHNNHDQSLVKTFRSFSMESLLQDIRFCLRGFARRPGFTAVALITLMLGIGANSAIFTLVNAVLLRPLPYVHPEQLVSIWGLKDAQRQLLSVPDIVDIQQRNRTFDGIGIARSQSVNLTGTDRPDRVVGNFVSAATLRLFGVKPVLGRIFTDEETKIGSGQPVVVINYANWQNRFGGQKDVLGKTLVLNGLPHAIIGVTPKGFIDPDQADLWLPITSAPSPGWFDRANTTVWAYGRLKADRTVQDGQADLQSILAQLEKEHASKTHAAISVSDMREGLVGGSRFMLFVLFGAVGAVLLIVCVNIANLQLVRASTREREMSVRAALGANRGRLISQALTESVMLAFVGGVLGIILGQWAVRSLVTIMPPLPLSDTVNLNLDLRVVLFSLAVALVTGVLFGAPAAFSGTRVNLQNALRARTDHASARRLSMRNFLVVTELSLCIVLLAAAGLFTRSLISLQNIDTGYHTDHVLTAEFRLPRVKYADSVKVNLFMTTLLEKLRAIPGVKSAALVDAVPLSGNFGTVAYVAQGQPEPAPDAFPSAQTTSVSDGYFHTMQIPLLAGRDFTRNDIVGTEPVAIINKEFADKTWPGESAIGKTVRLHTTPDVSVRVIGVVASVKMLTLSETPSTQLYASKIQNTGIFTSIVLRTVGEPDAMGNALRAAVWSVDKDQPVWKVRSMEYLLRRDLGPSTLSVKLIGAFALLALLLGIIGVYGVMSFTVAQRTREVGIRMALGARGDQVLRLILRSGTEVVVVAIIIGVAGALATGRYLQSQLYNVGASDPTTMVGVPLILAAVALIACWLPARRAARVDPAVTLRNE
ncbi:MAG: ABC transporter permease [Gemmatimonadaceae bacterium]